MATRTIKVTDLNKLLHALSSQKIMAKFPYFFSITEETQYDNVNSIIEDHGQINRCKNMQTIKNHLLLCEKGTLQHKEKLQTAGKLVKLAIELLKNAGMYCPEFEEELEVIILQFKNSPTRQSLNEVQENNLNRKGSFSL
ncbi:MAG: hypothetical protein LEGION0403_FIIPPAGN_01945 [Legionella sp.]|uniref:hypothetical protein n=1 Tax=Legionella sp. TaxID=459 RepID=UPI003D122B9D